MAAPRLAVPRSWVTVSYGSISVSVPPAWPTRPLGAHRTVGACGSIVFPRPVVDLDPGYTGALFCPALGAKEERVTEAARGNGVWLQGSGAPETPPRASFGCCTPLVAHHLIVHGLAVTFWYPRTGTTGTATVVEHGRGQSAHLVLGLDRSALIAARILASLRATAAS